MRRAIVSVVAFVIGVNVLLFVAGKLLPSPHGRDSSSYATTPRGFAAWAELLERNGHTVEHERRLPAEAPLDTRSTAIVLDPDTVTDADAAALARQVEAGGRLVAGGPQTRWLRALLGRAPRWRSGGARFWQPSGRSPATAGVRTVQTDGRARYTRTPAARPVLTARGTTMLAVARHGRGQVLLLADSSAVQNKQLGHDSNALLALRLAGAPGRPVRFYESVHGFGAQRGLRALPGNWKLALIGLVLAGLVWLIARGHRLGPPERTSDGGAPARRLYVDAMAATLARTHAPAEASEPLRADALDKLAARGAAGDEIPELAHPANTDQELVALGTASARIRGGRS